MKKRWLRSLSLGLALILLLSPAMALTPEQAGELLEGYYVDPVPRQVLEEPTVEGMIAALGDRFTQYFTAQEYEAFLAGMRDSAVVGIGVELESCAKGVEILKVLPGSPALEAGLAQGDQITAVDGRSAAGAGFTEIRSWITGEAGTQVRLTVLREGVSWEVTLTRREIVVPATETGLVDGHIGYITCTTFGEETRRHFEEGVEATDREADRYVVDLRGNGGGDVEAAVQAAGTFTGAGTLTYLRDRWGHYQGYRREEGALTRDPVIVLTNAGTASASELFASAVRDTGTGIVVGSRTYGKGVAQIVLDGGVLPSYFPQGDALKLTAYRYYSALGSSADQVGVIPHLLLEDAYAQRAALLLSGQAPQGGTHGMLRLDLKWRWYIDLSEALKTENRETFTRLLEAIPPETPLWLGTGGDIENGWEGTNAAQIAARYELEGYVPRTFSDLSSYPWQTEIETLHAYGLVEGGGDGSFRPESTLTRGQLCVMLAKAMQYKPSTPAKRFADVEPGMWYADGVNAMAERGLVTGYSDGLFHPEDPVDYEQALTILGRIASGLSMSLLEAHSAGMGEAEADYASWSGWARPYVWLLDGSQEVLGGELSLLWTRASQLEPSGAITRGEAACALCALLSYTNILPG